MNDLLHTRIADLGAWTISGANTVAFAPGTKIQAKRLILRYTTGNTTATNGVTVQRRPIAGVASNQETLFTFETTATTAAGDIDYADLGDATQSDSAISGAPGIGGQSTNTPDAENYPVIFPGEDIAFVSDGDGTAGVVNAYVEYLELPFNEEEIENGTDNDIVKLTTASG